MPDKHGLAVVMRGRDLRGLGPSGDRDATSLRAIAQPGWRLTGRSAAVRHAAWGQRRTLLGRLANQTPGSRGGELGGSMSASWPVCRT